MSKKHAFIPDTQLREGVPVEHIAAAGNYIAEKQPDVIVVIGDWWDLPSLSSYDKAGSLGWEDKDLMSDIEFGCDMMADFLSPIEAVNGYSPRLVFCMGNHEDRLRRAREHPEFRRVRRYLSDDLFRLRHFGFKVIPFQAVVKIDGILYSHYFVNPRSLMKRPMGGSITNRLDKLGHSFSMGHQQTHEVGAIYTATGERRRGLVSGAFYAHDEDYIGPQGNAQYWRGMVMKHEVRRGDYDLMEVSLDYLNENYQ